MQQVLSRREKKVGSGDIPGTCGASGTFFFFPFVCFLMSQHFDCLLFSRSHEVMYLFSAYTAQKGDGGNGVYGARKLDNIGEEAPQRHVLINEGSHIVSWTS
ncbi:hypothetical protein GDO81_018981 [Engystomops pustulosus]|uniref:Uncharacterized protein n=1 Tax=Engystomops pustulosus TaxID=76066 RepID=A0AAV6YG88_ENGPU|nr:hypothetical protein GDO81_018981 [Engystomops pustulosus]